MPCHPPCVDGSIRDHSGTPVCSTRFERTAPERLGRGPHTRTARALRSELSRSDPVSDQWGTGTPMAGCVACRFSHDAMYAFGCLSQHFPRCLPERKCTTACDAMRAASEMVARAASRGRRRKTKQLYIYIYKHLGYIRGGDIVVWWLYVTIVVYYIYYIHPGGHVGSNMAFGPFWGSSSIPLSSTRGVTTSSAGLRPLWSCAELQFQVSRSHAVGMTRPPKAAARGVLASLTLLRRGHFHM